MSQHLTIHDNDSYYQQIEDSNPFLSNPKISRLQWIQVAVMSVTILPIRIFFILITTLVTWSFAALVTYGLGVKSNEPVSNLRLRFYVVLQLLCRLILFFMGVHWIQVKGKRASSREAAILVVSPHSSWLDIIVFLANSPVPSGLSRVENSSFPFIGTLCAAAQVLWVSREDQNSRRSTIEAIKHRTKQPGHWPQLIVFSEGTTTNRSSIVRFKNGAFIPGIPVQPVTIEYLNSWDTVTWTCDNDDRICRLLWLSLCQIQISVRITYLNVYHPDELEQTHPHLYAHNCRQLMAKSLDLPCSEFSAEDNKLMMNAKQHGLPIQVGAIGFSLIRSKFDNFNFEQAAELLQHFARIAKPDQHRRGLIDKRKFLEFFGMPCCDVTERLYERYDHDRSGIVDFRKFVIGRLGYFSIDDTELADIFDRVSGGGVLQLDDLMSFEDHARGLDRDALVQLFYCITNRPLTVAKFDEFQLATSRWPEYARLLDEVTKKSEYEV